MGAISIISSGASTVVSCNDSSSTSSVDQQKANAIRNKIKNTNIIVSSNQVTDHHSRQPNTLKDILYALQYANQTLTKSDLRYILPSEATLVLNKAVPVAAIITVGHATARKDLNITLGTTDQDKANAIKAKITNVDLIAPAGTNPDTTNKVTIAAIKKTLQIANPMLLDSDLTKIKFNKATLHIATPISLTAIITVGHASTTITLHVAIEPNIDNFKKQLQALPKSDFNFFTSDFTKNSEGKYDSNYTPNQQRIITRLNVNLPNYRTFNNLLSFKGELKAGQTTNIEVFYNGEDQPITQIPITLITS